MAGVCQVCVSVLGCVHEQVCVGGKFLSAGMSDVLAGRDPCVCVSRSRRACVHALVLLTETVCIGVRAVCQCVRVPLSISYMCQCDCRHECGYKSVV